MSLPPLPWSYQTNARLGDHEGNGFVYLLDANGRKIGTFWGKPDEKMAVAQMVMDASDAMAKRPTAPEQRAKGGPTEKHPDRPCCKRDGSCCDFCCGN